MDETNYASHPETECVELARKGNLMAFNQLALAYQDIAFRLADRMLNDAASAADIVQSGFLSAFLDIKNFHCGNFRGWLLRIIRNACLDEIRRRKRRRLLALEPLDEEGDEIENATWLTDPAWSPEEVLVQQESWENLNRCLRLLPSQMREVIVLIDIEGLEYDEAATTLDIPMGTLKSRLWRARARFREVLTVEQRNQKSYHPDEWLPTHVPLLEVHRTWT